jgi:hypothetical protein
MVRAKVWVSAVRRVPIVRGKYSSTGTKQENHKTITRQSQDKTRQDKTRQVKTTQDKTRQEKTRQDKTG